MAHLSQQRFLCLVKSIYPSYFKDAIVFDVGSADINGTNRFLFKNCFYHGWDLMPWKNVDYVAPFKVGSGWADIVISTEMAEHSPTYKEDITNMDNAEPEMLILTCASGNRPIHGTDSTTPLGSPFKGITYYRNLEVSDIEPLVKGKFAYFEFFKGNNGNDLYFIGFKSEPKFSPSLFRFIRLFTYRFILNRLHDHKQFLKKIFK